MGLLSTSVLRINLLTQCNSSFNVLQTVCASMTIYHGSYPSCENATMR